MKRKMNVNTTTEQTAEQTAEQTTEQTAEQTAEQTTEQTAEQTTEQPTETQVTETQSAIECHAQMEKLNALTNTINVLLTVQRRSDYGIAYVLNLIKKHHKEDIKVLGFKNVEEYAEHHFGFAKSTYHAYTKVSERFIKPVTDTRKLLTSGKTETFEIVNVVSDTAFDVLTDVDGYEFSISQMLELLPLTETELQEHIEEFSSSDTTKSIREKVKAIKTAIPASATQTGEPAGEPAGEPTGEPAGEPTGEPAGEPAGEPTGEPAGEPMTDNKRILTILSIANDIENETFRNALVELLNSFING